VLHLDVISRVRYLDRRNPVAEDEEAQAVAKKIRESRRAIRKGVYPSVETPAEGVRTPEMR